MLVLQWLAGGFYLLNKIFLSFSEHARFDGNEIKRRHWRILSWAVYLIGLPPWIVIFVRERNWIAASIEASGTPAMALGLIIAIRGLETKPPRWLDRLALVCIPLGFAYSLYDFGGLRQISQWLEIFLVGGFLIGTYQLAKERAGGYLWYVLMHVSCGYLMWIEHYPWLFLQQVVSLVFILDAFLMTRKKQRKD